KDEFIATLCDFNEALYEVTLELFIYLFDQPLINLEKDKHTEWKFYDKKQVQQMHKKKEFIPMIQDNIDTIYWYIRNYKKCIQNTDNQYESKIVKLHNSFIRQCEAEESHEFKNKLVKLLNENGLIANIIFCKQEDFGVDIVKNIKKAIGSPELQKIQSSFKCFGEEILGIIVYNSEKLSNPLMKSAKIWFDSCCSEIKIINEKEILNFFKDNKKRNKRRIMMEYTNPQADEFVIGISKLKGFKAEKCIDLRKLKNIIIDENSKEKNLADLKKLIDSIVNREETYEESSKTILKRELTNLFKVKTSFNLKKPSFPWRGAKNSLQIDSFTYKIPLDEENKATIYLCTSKQFFDRYEMCEFDKKNGVSYFNRNLFENLTKAINFFDQNKEKLFKYFEKAIDLIFS
ncbi:1919_t:CDS:2, partial [Dentiscutata erythropus]